MSAIGGSGITAATIRVPVVLDLDAWQAGLKEAQAKATRAGLDGKDGVAGKDGTGAATKEATKAEREKRIDYLAKAVFLLKTAWQVTQKIYQRISESVQRLAEYRGVSDPVTGAFLRMEASVSRAFDSFVLGTLKSQAVQGALAGISSAAQDAAKWANSLGERIDHWAKSNAGDVAYFAGIVRGTTAFLVSLPNTVMAGFRAIAGGIATVAGKVVEFLAGLGESLGSVLDWAGFDRAAKSVRGLSSEWKSFGAALADIGKVEVASAISDLGDSFERIGRVALDTEAKVRSMLEEIDPTKSTARGDPLLSESGQAIVAAMDDVANRVGDSWQAATDRVRQLLDQLAKEATDSKTAGLFVGGERLLSGFAALGAQAEAAFGRSSRAAQVFAKVQTAAAAIVAVVKGTMEVGEGFAVAEENPLAAAAHGAAATAFFAAAGLAGARTAGVGRPNVSYGRDAALDNRSITETVEKTPVVVLLHIEGNVLGSEEYIQQSLLPRMRNLIEERGVTFPATDIVGGRT